MALLFLQYFHCLTVCLSVPWVYNVMPINHYSQGNKKRKLDGGKVTHRNQESKKGKYWPSAAAVIALTFGIFSVTPITLSITGGLTVGKDYCNGGI
jgi:hypothetical protein